jgi:transcription initiation factor TFIID subunit 1
MKPWQPVVSVPITNKKDDKDKRLNPQDYFKDRFKLSVQKGKFCLFEHIDQHPLFVNNFGMASRLKRFYYDDK